jgi:hypothetical protein
MAGKAMPISLWTKPKSLQHAEAADGEQTNYLTKAAVRDLKNAIELGKAGKVDVAIESTELALGHLSQAK